MCSFILQERHLYPGRGCEQGEAVLPLLLDQPPQDDRPHPVLPRRDVQPRRQPVRPPAVPLQPALVVAVPVNRRRTRSAQSPAPVAASVVIGRRRCSGCY